MSSLFLSMPPGFSVGVLLVAPVALVFIKLIIK